MNKRLWITLLAFCCLITAWGQESDSKRINNIKRNSQYLYAEATMKDPDEAYNTALELLGGYIDEYVQSKRKYNSSDNIIIKDVSSKSERIQMKRGEMTRVFVYVKKDDIIPATSATLRENAGKKEENAEDLGAMIEDMGNVGDASLKLSQTWQQEVVDQLLNCATLTEAKALLNRQKTEFKVKRTGAASSCRNSAECFWVVGDASGALITVLGPGAEQRTNFRTLQYDALENYNAGTSVWFIMAK